MPASVYLANQYPFPIHRFRRLPLLPIILFILLVIPAAHGADLSYELGFSPNGESLQIVLRGISEAKESVLVAAYSFTSKPVSEALLEAHRRGVKVSVVADQKGNSGRYTAVNFLANQGVPVRLNGQYAIMHHKFMVIDGKRGVVVARMRGQAERECRNQTSRSETVRPAQFHA